MKKHLLLVAVLLVAGYCRAQCYYEINDYNFFTGVRTLLTQPVKVCKTESTYIDFSLRRIVLINDDTISSLSISYSDPFAERVCIDRTTRVLLQLKDGSELYLRYGGYKKKCTDDNILFDVLLTNSDMDKLRETPVTGLKIFFTDYQLPGVIDSNKVNYFIDNLDCITFIPCNYVTGEMDTAAGDIISAPGAELIEYVPEGTYKLRLALIKEQDITAKYFTVSFNFYLPDGNAANHFPERCIAPGKTNIRFLLMNGQVVEATSFFGEKECDNIKLTARFQLKNEDIAKLKESPVTDFRFYYVNDFYEEVHVSPGNFFYFIDYMHCVE